MDSRDLLGQVDFAVLDAVHRGALRSRCVPCQIGVLRGRPAAQTILSEVLRRSEREGLLRSCRDASGRRYELTAAGRARLRANRRFRAALLGMLARSR